MWSRGLGWINGFPNKSRFSRLSLRKSLGRAASWLCAADRYLNLESRPMWNGKHTSSLSSSFRLTSSLSWQNWEGRDGSRFWLTSRIWRVRCRVDRQRASLKASRWLLWRMSSERQLRSPIVAGSFLIWLLLRSSLRKAEKKRKTKGKLSYTEQNSIYFSGLLGKLPFKQKSTIQCLSDAWNNNQQN